MIDLTSINQNLDKEQKYIALEEQLKLFVKGENNLIANLSNITSLLKYGMNFFWVGVYKVIEDELVLGPFQGTVACTRIPKGRGVCGTCWERNETLIVDNVNVFPGHIACCSVSKSEIVLPIRNNRGEVAFILDIDSEKLHTFDERDQEGLEKVVKIIETFI